jgi:ABC-type multidrug transport system fused ATPase/permease subunit
VLFFVVAFHPAGIEHFTSVSSQTRYVWVFGMLVGILIGTRIVEGAVYATVTMTASRRLHDENFKIVLHGTMAYFDTTPLGRILNRFSGEVSSEGCCDPPSPSCRIGSGDLDLVDTRLPDVSEIALQYLSQCAVSLVIICIVFPWFIAPMVPLLVVFYFITRCVEWVVHGQYRRGHHATVFVSESFGTARET